MNHENNNQESFAIKNIEGEQISALIEKIKVLEEENKKLADKNRRLKDIEKEKEKVERKLKDWMEKYKILENDAIHDHLTGLKKRKYFEERAEEIISSLNNPGHEDRREGYDHFSVLFMDIDHFKKINDTLGHNEGDMVLKKVSEIISKNVRDSDIVVRWGGEEFLIGLPGADEDEACNIAEKIRKAVENDRGKISVTLSIGVAPYDSALDKDLLVKNADKALYYAKNTGRNNVKKYAEIPDDFEIEKK